MTFHHLNSVLFAASVAALVSYVALIVAAVLVEEWNR